MRSDRKRLIINPKLHDEFLFKVNNLSVLDNFLDEKHKTPVNILSKFLKKDADLYLHGSVINNYLIKGQKQYGDVDLMVVGDSHCIDGKIKCLNDVSYSGSILNLSPSGRILDQNTAFQGVIPFFYAVRRIDDKQASQQEFHHYKFSNVDISEPSKIDAPSKVSIDVLLMNNAVFKDAMINDYVFQFSPRIVFDSD